MPLINIYFHLQLNQMIKSQMTKMALIRSNKYLGNFFFFKASSGLADIFLQINLQKRISPF